MVSDAKLILQEQRATATSEFPFANHRFSIGEYIRLVHEVSRQQDHLAVSPRLEKGPHLSSRIRIYTSSWFIEDDNFRIADDSNSHG